MPAELTVMVASGDIVLRQQVLEYLRDCGYRGLAAASTDEAFDLLRSKIVVDYLLIDMRSPDAVDGFALSNWVRDQGMPTEVILSASVEKTARKANELCEEGPEQSPPFDPQILIRRLSLATAQRLPRRRADVAGDMPPVG